MEEMQEDSVENKQIKNISIETMFYPKFYDYHEKKIDLIETKTTQKYYLELSIKHSGSLLLWNGYHYIFSKNSIDTMHTLVGHILLLKHFYKVWNDQAFEKYQECSSYIKSKHISIQFEIITKGYLGHHGSIPNEDYIVVIGICNTNYKEYFWDTWDILNFCLRYKLPFNEYWIGLGSSLQKVMEWYECNWEDMYYFSSVDYLNQCDYFHVEGMYSHDVYQGQLLEGIVARYVPYDPQELHDELLVEDYIAFILSRIKEQGTDHDRAVVKDYIINLSNLFQTANKEEIEIKLRDALFVYYTNNTSEITKPTKYYYVKLPEAGINVSKLISKLSSCTSHYETQTKRILELFHTLNKLNIVYNFRVFRSANEEAGDDTTLYCMIHLPFDKVYHTYNSRKMNEMMTLCRGFCIKIVLFDSNTSSLTPTTPLASETKDKFYMIKLKFLPYMVRTIACREGLNYIKKDGNSLNGYEVYISNLMHRKWGLSNNSVQKWHPFLLAWGNYVISLISDCTLSESNYLDYYEKFNALYGSGKLTVSHPTSSSPSDVKFNGILFLVGPNQTQIQSLSTYLSTKLQCSNTNALTLSDLTEVIILNTLQTSFNSGRIVTCNITTNIPNKFKSILSKYKQYLNVIFVGCTEIELAEYVQQNNLVNNEEKKLYGLAKSWRKRCKDLLNSNIDISSGCFTLKENEWMPQSDEIDKLIGRINELSLSVQESLSNNTINDKRKGALFFFPGIPGCGKTTLSNHITQENLSELQPEYFRNNNRQILINTSDKPKTITQKTNKYWSSVHLEKISCPSSIYIADKNSPVNVWNEIGAICYKTNSVAFCVIPAGKAFVSTELKVQRFDGGRFVGNDAVYYPFSLHYLAFCMHNVLKRSGNNDQRVLDGTEEYVCMTIIKFFSFYKNVTADKFIDLFLMKMQKESAMYCPTPVYVPIFKSGYSTLPLLPYGIESVLRDALKLQYEMDTKQQQGNKRPHNESKAEMEYKLREAFDTYPIESLLNDILQSESITKASFLSQVAECLTDLENYTAMDSNEQQQDNDLARNIKYVSIDIPVEEVYNFLSKNYNEDIKEFFEQIGYDVNNIPKANSTGNTKGYRIFDTHVTMSHYSSSTQKEMKSKFEALENMIIPVYIKSFYFSKRIAALGVTVSSKTQKEPFVHVPDGMNEWIHITLWCGKDENTLMDVEKKESNDLPKMCLVNRAREVRFLDPGIVYGTLKFVMMDS